MEDKTFLVYEDEIGQAEVRDDMVARIAALAALGVDGVDSLENGITLDKISSVSWKKLAAGVDVIENGNAIEVYIAMIVAMGTNIPEACNSVQKKVKSEIEGMLGLKVNHVNIRVSSVKIG